ncbi:class E sortase, partial [Streptomyces sp. SID7499]|nr:class E sortase [Streptomyces sp. SID7499]
MAARTEHDERAGTSTSRVDAPPVRRRGRHPVATAVSVFGELLITAGLVLA